MDQGSWVDPTARIGEGVRVFPGVYVGPESVIGPETVLYPGVYVGAGVTIGTLDILSVKGFGRWSMLWSPLIGARPTIGTSTLPGRTSTTWRSCIGPSAQDLSLGQRVPICTLP